MNRFDVWHRWLSILGVVIVVFGLGMSLLGGTAVFDLLNHQVDPVFWGAQPVPAQALAFRGWIYGVTGATMAGWGVFIVFLVRHAFARREAWAWNCLALGMLVWYVPDTAMSLAFGVTFNAAFNTVLLAAVALPLAFTRHEFLGASR